MNGSRRLQVNLNVVNDSAIQYVNEKLYLTYLSNYFSAISRLSPLVFPMIWIDEVCRKIHQNFIVFAFDF